MGAADVYESARYGCGFVGNFYGVAVGSFFGKLYLYAVFIQNRIGREIFFVFIIGYYYVYFAVFGCGNENNVIGSFFILGFVILLAFEFYYESFKVESFETDFHFKIAFIAADGIFYILHLFFDGAFALAFRFGCFCNILIPGIREMLFIRNYAVLFFDGEHSIIFFFIAVTGLFVRTEFGAGRSVEKCCGRAVHSGVSVRTGKHTRAEKRAQSRQKRYGKRQNYT